MCDYRVRFERIKKLWGNTCVNYLLTQFYRSQFSTHNSFTSKLTGDFHSQFIMYDWDKQKGTLFKKIKQKLHALFLTTRPTAYMWRTALHVLYYTNKLSSEVDLYIILKLGTH
jgi:hypothetical protein